MFLAIRVWRYEHWVPHIMFDTYYTFVRQQLLELTSNAAAYAQSWLTTAKQAARQGKVQARCCAVIYCCSSDAWLDGTIISVLCEKILFNQFWVSLLLSYFILNWEMRELIWVRTENFCIPKSIITRDVWLKSHF